VAVEADFGGVLNFRVSGVGFSPIRTQGRPRARRLRRPAARRWGLTPASGPKGGVGAANARPRPFPQRPVRFYHDRRCLPLAATAALEADSGGVSYFRVSGRGSPQVLSNVSVMAWQSLARLPRRQGQLVGNGGTTRSRGGGAEPVTLHFGDQHLQMRDHRCGSRCACFRFATRLSLDGEGGAKCFDVGGNRFVHSNDSITIRW
jgi:hypothetical protein